MIAVFAKNKDLFSPIISGKVFSPDSLSPAISLMSNGIVIAKTKRNRSIVINVTCIRPNEFPDCIMGRRIVLTDQIKEIKKILRKGISLSRMKFFLVLKIGSE